MPARKQLLPGCHAPPAAAPPPSAAADTRLRLRGAVKSTSSMDAPDAEAAAPWEVRQGTRGAAVLAHIMPRSPCPWPPRHLPARVASRRFFSSILGACTPCCSSLAFPFASSRLPARSHCARHHRLMLLIGSQPAPRALALGVRRTCLPRQPLFLHRRGEARQPLAALLNAQRRRARRPAPAPCAPGPQAQPMDCPEDAAAPAVPAPPPAVGHAPPCPATPACAPLPAPPRRAHAHLPSPCLMLPDVRAFCSCCRCPSSPAPLNPPRCRRRAHQVPGRRCCGPAGRRGRRSCRRCSRRC